ncbi:MAG: GTP-binding protein [Candidatus Pacebacteria bacterium]|nr:GTP-binding protein [Candidatus Paceibacterota bacterium]
MINSSINENKRSPVVVVLGHVDHGKTSLLDYIRKANVAKGEAGGITQSIGAYEIDHKVKETGQTRKITFIDTPGHEAFSKMRGRGAKVADVAILLVAADDGVQNQTKEAIKIIQDAKIPYVVAINKIDKQPDLSAVKNQLTSAGVLMEGYGGDVANVGVSAKTGEGVEELLDLLLLSADIEDMSFDPKNPGSAFVLESHMDPKRGNIVTVIIKDGELKVGDFVDSASASGKIKSLEDFIGKKIVSARPSTPVAISGFTDLPKIGDMISVVPKLDKISKTQKNNLNSIKRVVKADEKSLTLVLKADVSGSLEALSESIKALKLPKEINLKIVAESVGAITDGDVQFAISTGSKIIGFKTYPTKQAENLIRDHKVECITSEIIYEILEKLENIYKVLSDVKKGILEILAVFIVKGKEQVIGGKVIMGEIVNNSTLEIVRDGARVGELKIINLQQGKRDASKVVEGMECGMLVSYVGELKARDQLLLR